jgi:AcrR family transcriptional regulator
MSTRQDQKAATRRRLLHQAERLVVRNGFATTRTIDVARAAGVAHGSVFVHFPSREDLMLTVASEMGRRLTDRLHELAAAGTGLRPALTAHVGCIAEHEELYHRLLIEGPSLPSDFRATWSGMQSAVASHILTAAEVDIRAERIRPMPTHLLFNTWLGLVHHYVGNRELFMATGPARGASPGEPDQSPDRTALAVHGPALVDHYINLLSP